VNLIAFLSGVIVTTFGASGVFFLKLWRVSRDRLFLYFCIACWLLTLDRLALMCVPEAGSAVRTVVTERSSWVVLLRLAGFSMIVWAVLDKNRSAARRDYGNSGKRRDN
jgi:hypothetical protein